MPHKDKRREAYMRQRKLSRNRGIGFLFTFEDWVAWWEEHLGQDWLNRRGVKGDQFVMARIGDKGDYQRGNVQCITASQNMSDSWMNVVRNTGGPYFSGQKHKPETLTLMREQKLGEKNPFYGRKHSAETREKMKHSQTLRRAVARGGII
jgi:NUMOD3 motif